MITINAAFVKQCQRRAAAMKGVYITQKKNGQKSYRASLTAGGRHISLGSYSSQKKAHEAYLTGSAILHEKSAYPFPDVLSSKKASILRYDKIILLCNLRDNGMYISQPIYVYRRFFHYYLSDSEFLTFDKEDLFYYATRRIMRRGGHLFVADYGMQVTITGRYGIRPFAVKDRDYRFVNGDDRDFRYSNIEIINPYYGVLREGTFGQYRYLARIHLNGNFRIGVFDSPQAAAIAYNKAVDICKGLGLDKNFPINYLENVPAGEYAEIYDSIQIPRTITDYLAP